MIHHVHSMLSSGPETSAAGNTNKQVSPDAMDSFETALSDASSPSLGTLGTDPNAGQVSTAPASTSTTAGSASSTAAASGSTDGTVEALFGSTSGTAAPAVHTPTTTVTSSASTTSAAADSAVAFDNAYWANQPAAVQPLRTMQDPQEREDYAQQLASEGYTIDVPIMVWGWDPSIVTSMRQADGYTWVPSAMQNPVQVAPGLGSMGGMAAYDPNNPPAGSIAVPAAGSTAV
jgi:hypothetical protein